jgi:hypothetical protein
VQADSADNINVDRRLGILIKLRVGGDLKPGLAVEQLKVHYAGTINPFAKGDATISYTIRNTGNAILSARQAASVSGPAGWLRAEAAAHGPAQQLLPGESRKVSVAVPAVAPGVRLTATATLTPLITDAAGSTTALPPILATQHGWAIPWTLLLLVIIVLGVLAGGIPLLRRRRRRHTARQDARVQEAVEQALRDQQVDAH